MNDIAGICSHSQ